MDALNRKRAEACMCQNVNVSDDYHWIWTKSGKNEHELIRWVYTVSLMNKKTRVKRWFLQITRKARKQRTKRRKKSINFLFLFFFSSSMVDQQNGKRKAERNMRVKIKTKGFSYKMGWRRSAKAAERRIYRYYRRPNADVRGEYPTTRQNFTCGRQGRDGKNGEKEKANNMNTSRAAMNWIIYLDHRLLFLTTDLWLSGSVLALGLWLALALRLTFAEFDVDDVVEVVVGFLRIPRRLSVGYWQGRDRRWHWLSELRIQSVFTWISREQHRKRTCTFFHRHPSEEARMRSYVLDKIRRLEQVSCLDFACYCLR